MVKPSDKPQADDELSDGQIEVISQLEDSKVIAQKLFGLKEDQAPTPEMVFGCYDRVFEAFMDDEDDDEDEDDED